MAVLVAGNPANSTQQDKPRAGEVGGREASLTLCFLKPRQTAAALKPVTLLNECCRKKKNTECFTRLHIASKRVGMRLPTPSTVSGHKYARFWKRKKWKEAGSEQLARTRALGAGSGWERWERTAGHNPEQKWAAGHRVRWDFP